MAHIDLDKLTSHLTRKLDAECARILSFRRRLEGWSMQTFRVELEYLKRGEEVRRSLIIRMEPDCGMLDAYDVSAEYRVLEALQDTGVAVPRIWWCETDPEVLGHPFYVMDEAEGEAHLISPSRMHDPSWRLIPNGAQRRSLGEDFIRNLALIHNLDWGAKGLGFLGTLEAGQNVGLRQIERWQGAITRAGFHSRPVVAYAKRWLMDNVPECPRVSLVHGDYRIGNYLCRHGRIKAILDWELVHLGDPMEDVAYVLASAWRSPSPDRWVSHLMPEAEFCRRYSEASGIEVDPQRLRFYRVLNAFRSVAMQATAANAFRSKSAVDLRVGVFGMLWYAGCFDLMRLLNEYKYRPGRGTV